MPIAKSLESISHRINRLRRKKCKYGHSRHDAIVEIDHRTGGIRLRCRQCRNERQRRYYAEGRLYRYGLKGS